MKSYKSRKNYNRNRKIRSKKRYRKNYNRNRKIRSKKRYRKKRIQRGGSGNIERKPTIWVNPDISNNSITSGMLRTKGYQENIRYDFDTRTKVISWYNGENEKLDQYHFAEIYSLDWYNGENHRDTNRIKITLKIKRIYKNKMTITLLKNISKFFTAYPDLIVTKITKKIGKYVELYTNGTINYTSNYDNANLLYYNFTSYLWLTTQDINLPKPIREIKIEDVIPHALNPKEATFYTFYFEKTIELISTDEESIKLLKKIKEEFDEFEKLKKKLVSTYTHENSKNNTHTYEPESD
jgi:hypothetical protein